MEKEQSLFSTAASPLASRGFAPRGDKKFLAKIRKTAKEIFYKQKKSTKEILNKQIKWGDLLFFGGLGVSHPPRK